MSHKPESSRETLQSDPVERGLDAMIPDELKLKKALQVLAAILLFAGGVRHVLRSTNIDERVGAHLNESHRFGDAFGKHSGGSSLKDNSAEESE